MPEKINTTKCSPAQMRRNLELVEVLEQLGMDFVPVPVLNADDRRRLLDDCETRLAQILGEVEKGEQ